MAIPYTETFATEEERIKYDEQRANELENSLRNQVKAEVAPDTEMSKDKYFLVLQKFGLARARLSQTETDLVYKGRPSRSYKNESYNTTYKGR